MKIHRWAALTFARRDPFRATRLLRWHVACCCGPDRTSPPLPRERNLLPVITMTFSVPFRLPFAAYSDPTGDAQPDPLRPAGLRRAIEPRLYRAAVLDGTGSGHAPKVEMRRSANASNSSQVAEPTARCRITRWRATPQQFAWLLLICGVIACLLISGCGVVHEPPFRAAPFRATPEPDLAVTTLDKSDIDRLAALMQVQDAIRRGCDVAGRFPLPEPVQTQMALILDLYLSRERDLGALVTVKHAPKPAPAAAHHSARLQELERTPAANWSRALIVFHRDLQIDALRLLRDAADRSLDPDVQAFAQRQIPAVASALDHLQELPDAR